MCYYCWRPEHVHVLQEEKIEDENRREDERLAEQGDVSETDISEIPL